MAGASEDEAAAGAAGDGVRVSKLLSEQGFCSRREADEYIRKGLVTVDGEVVVELGTKANRSQKVELQRQAATMQNALKTILLNKPVGFVSHADDNHIYKPAASLISPSNYFSYGSSYGPPGGPAGGSLAPMILKGLAPAGRLDIDSSGLLVLTQDGRISKTIIGQDSPISKEYLVRVKGNLSSHGLSLLRNGLELDGKALRTAEVKWQNEDQLNFVLQEGKKRQIRRMCELVGLTVTSLKRVRIGRITLGALPVGKWRYLSKKEFF
jgi:23S rRNA pseudouridine2604 synthase